MTTLAGEVPPNLDHTEGGADEGSGALAETSIPHERLLIEAWPDPVIDAIGHDPRSAYVETFWLPVLGPSTTWLLRHLVGRLEASPGGIEIDTEETARALGLGERLGPNAPFARTVRRCVDFQMAEWHGPLRLAIRRRLPPLARRHLRRLPESLQARHEAELEVTGRVPEIERMRRHGRQLALSLLDLGEDQSAAEQQLRRWAFHPALAAECAAWAVADRLVHPNVGARTSDGASAPGVRGPLPFPPRARS